VTILRCDRQCLPCPLNSNTHTVLVVDDNPSVTQILGHVLACHGYSVATAASGMEAITVAKQRTIDAALIDVHMPGMSGIEVCRALRAENATTGTAPSVWMITGAPTAEIRRLAIEAGALAVLAKPFGVDELLGRLTEQLERVAANAGAEARA